MPSFTAHTPTLTSKGPIIHIMVGLPKTTREARAEKKQTVPGLIPVNALIDTGATFTGISQRIVKELDLTPHDVITMLTAGQPTLSNVYKIYIDIGFAFKTHIIFDPLKVGEISLVGQVDIDCLIGRDVLSKTVFLYIGYANTFSLSI